MDCGELTGAARVQPGEVRGERQAAEIFDHAGIASLQANHFAECITRASGSNHFCCECAAGGYGFCFAAEDKHPGGKLETQFAQIFGALAVEDFDTFLDFERVADFAAEGLLHIGDERDNFFAHAYAGFDHQLGQVLASFCFFMKAPSPVFTSRTSASIPSAIFLLMMEAVIK